MATWKKVRQELNLTIEDEKLIEMEKKLIATMVAIRESKGISQEQLAIECGMKQPTIARMEKSIHSPQLDNLLKVLLPLGYTLQIVPLKKI